MHQFKTEMKHAYSKLNTWIISIIAAILLGWLLFAFTDHEHIAGNIGRAYATTNFIVQVLLAVMFGIVAGLIWHKHTKMNVAKEGGFAAVGGVLGALVGGCPACGITLAGVLGIGSIFTALPFFGLELKVLGVVLLLYSMYSLTRQSCKLKPSKT